MTRRYERHPLYGDIPMIGREFRDPDGHSRIVYEYDLDFQPKLPPGAIRGDPRKQNLCFGHNVPQYFYVNHERTCVQCGRDFIFAAREQKFWYEYLGFYGTSVAIRCPKCRHIRRTESALRAQIAAARSSLERDPDDPAALLALAEAIARYHQRTVTWKFGRGNRRLPAGTQTCAPGI